MTLAGFTNQPGDHSKYDRFRADVVGTYYCGPWNEPVYDVLKPVEQNIKWAPTPGYAGCTDWYRVVKKFTINEPATFRRLVYQGGICEGTNILIDGSFKEHINMEWGLWDIHLEPPFPGDGYDNAYNESETKALNNLTQHYAGIGADLAQARKTCDEFAQLVLRTGGFINAMKRGNWQLAGNNLLGGKTNGWKPAQKTLADNWLQFIYGWKPLANDLYEAQQLAHDALLKPVPIMARGHGTSSLTYDFPLDRAHANVSLKTSHLTYLEANVVNPLLYYLNSAGLINPISIAWETVPFSFVLDWFIPVGQTLQAITAGVGLQSNGGWTSSHYDWTMDINRRVDYYPPGESFAAFVTPGHLQTKQFQFRRVCHADFPRPKLYADLTPYSTIRAVNALALVRHLV
jgi:hypothetical protein